MAITPLIWGLNESIPIDIDVEDQNTGLGLTGQAGFISLTIQRLADGLYWSGSEWSATLTILSTAEVDPVNQPGRYLYTLPASANATANRYEAHVKIYNPPIITSEGYELHVSMDLNLNVYDVVGADT